MKRLGILVYGAAILGAALITARETYQPSAYLYREHADGALALGVAGWLIATLGPLAVSVGVWTLARRSGARWVLHALFIPMAIIVYNAGAALLFRAAGVPDGDSIEGRTLLAASGFLFVALIVHAAALIAEGYSRFRRRTNGSN